LHSETTILVSGDLALLVVAAADARHVPELLLLCTGGKVIPPASIHL